MMPPVDVLILGGGPAGLTAALYAARAKRKTLVAAGPMPGGQISQTSIVENYPGFPEGVSGVDLTDKFRAQAERFGAEYLDSAATSINLGTRPFKAILGERAVEAHSIIIATGMTHRKLGVPGEDHLMGRGVFVCATCDAILYEGLQVAVVGGGDSALQEALDLARYAEKVTIIHRRGEFRASRYLVDKVQADPRISFRMESTVKEIQGEKRVTGLIICGKNGEESVLEADGVLIAVGWDPNTSVFRRQLNLDENGYLPASGVFTEIPGVFVAGDLQDRVYRQVVTSCASGCIAALEADKYLSGQVPG